jgi:hypothetical protein
MNTVRAMMKTPVMTIDASTIGYPSTTRKALESGPR